MSGRNRFITTKEGVVHIVERRSLVSSTEPTHQYRTICGETFPVVLDKATKEEYEAAYAQAHANYKGEFKPYRIDVFYTWRTDGKRSADSYFGGLSKLPWWRLTHPDPKGCPDCLRPRRKER